MLTRMLTAVVLAPIPQVPAPPCTLAGPPVDVRWSGAIPPASTAEAPLRVVADVPLPGSASRFDYQSLEPASGRLFISHMGAGQLVVFDVRAGRVIANLDGFPTVTGVLAVPVEHRAYVSATGDHAVVVADDSTFRVVARVPGPRFPDGIAYAPERRRVFVSDESGRRDFVIDATTNTVVAQVELGGEAEAGVGAVFEERDGSLVQLGWYRAPKAHSVAVDPATHRVYLPLANVSGQPVLRVLAPSDSR